MQNTRRELLKGGLGVATLAALGIPEWALPALAQGETLVPFNDYPENFSANPAPDRRVLDIRTIDGPITPADKFFAIQHYGQPEVDAATYKLKVSGLVKNPLALTVDELRKMGSQEITAGYECSGNRRPVQALVSNGRWTGVPLKAVLDKAGVEPSAREFVFFGADHGEEDVEFRTSTFKVDQQFGRSLQRDQAYGTGAMVVYALNGQPLTRHQGFPVRLVVPGWYGVANVKWLAQIHAQEDAFLGKWQARWYRSLRGETIDGQTKWVERPITRMGFKSVVARVTRTGPDCTVTGFVLSDGTVPKLVEVKVDDGPWQPATLDAATMKDKYSWKLFTYAWKAPSPGKHTLVSRVTGVDGRVQPTEQDLVNKKTFLEDNSQHPRTVTIA
jgi:DMSO/TMAO reductase YedYZ molybdopterin-dependent catalytic subunit